MPREEIAIVGGGPAGLVLSLFVKNYDVVIFEKHREVGRPKHCAGYVGYETFKVFSSLTSSEILDKAYNTLVFHTPRGSFRISSSKPFIYRIDRPVLEDKLLDRALKQGVEVCFGARARPTPQPGGLIVNDRELRYKWIIASDGSWSYFRRAYWKSKTRFIFGLNTVYRQVDGIDDEVHVIYSDLTPNFFAWYSTTRDGDALVGYGSATHVDPLRIASLIERRTRVKLMNPIETFGGLILRGVMLNKPVRRNVLLFGDSACMVKPYSGGGLGVISRLAPYLGLSIDNDDLSTYMSLYSRTRKRILQEYLAVSLLRGNYYWIPAYVLNFLKNIVGIELDLLEVFDDHAIVLTRAIPYLLMAFLFMNLGY